MMPKFSPGDNVLASSLPYVLHAPQIHDVIVFWEKRAKKIMIKKITEITNNTFVVSGENKTDSLTIEGIRKSDILGKVITKI